MTSWAIVALPEEQDRVNQVSSEPVPHMTLLFLGEQDDDAMAERIAGFVEHATESSLHRFGMSVDRRGTLGPEDADVLFFNTKYSSDIVRFRANLLQNLDIFKCYRSTEQYPEWTPHITLGYPATPAKNPPDEYGISWVSFDRIAFWNEDYDGPTFVIPNSDEVDLGHSALTHISTPARKKAEAKGQTMSGGSFPIRNGKDLENAIQAYGRAANKAAAKAWIIKRARELGLTSKLPKVWDESSSIKHEEDLQHHGVKGMHWGVRRKVTSELHKMKRSELDRTNPTHRAELHRRNTRNQALVGAGILAVRALPVATAAAGSAYLAYNGRRNAKVFGTSTSSLNTKAISDGHTFVLHLMANGSFGA